MSDKLEMKPCPYEKACTCTMTEPCDGCEHYAEYIENRFDGYPCDCIITELLEAEAKIATLEAELEKYQWVSVDERLPEDTQHVRILNKSKQATHGWHVDGVWRFVMCWEDQGFFFSGDATNITHWKPITLPTQPCQGYCSSCLTVDCKDRTELKEQSNDK